MDKRHINLRWLQMSETSLRKKARESNTYIAVLVPVGMILLLFGGLLFSPNVQQALFPPDFEPDVDGEGGDHWEKAEWKHGQYMVPLNLSYYVNFFDGLMDVSDPDDIPYFVGNFTLNNTNLWEEPGRKDYSFLHMDVIGQSLFILLDLCGKTDNSTENEGFFLSLDTNGDRLDLVDVAYETVLATIEGRQPVFVDNGSEYLSYTPQNGTVELLPPLDELADFLGGWYFNTTINNSVIARGYGPTPNSALNHVYYEIEIPLTELNYTTEDLEAGQFNTDTFGIQVTGSLGSTGPIEPFGNMTLPILYMMPCFSLPIIESMYFAVGNDEYDLNNRP